MKSMKSFLTVFFTVLALFLVSCSPWIVRFHNEDRVDPWLETISTGHPPEIEISGKWRDAQTTGLFGWGEGYLRQDQSKISGAIGGYSVKGAVSGKIVYLALLSKRAVYYTARLEYSQDSLIGHYFKGFDKKQTRGYHSMALEKIVGATKE